MYKYEFVLAFLKHLSPLVSMETARQIDESLLLHTFVIFDLVLPFVLFIPPFHVGSSGL